MKGQHNLTIFLDNFSTNFRRNSTRKIVRWYEELINLNHLTIFITEFHQKVVEKLSKKIQLSLSYSSLLGRYFTSLAGSMTGRCKPDDHTKDRKDDQSFCARVWLKVRPQKSTGKFFTRSFSVAVTIKTIREKYLEQY